MYGHPNAPSGFGWTPQPLKQRRKRIARRLVVWGVSAGVSVAFLALSAYLGGAIL